MKTLTHLTSQYIQQGCCHYNQEKRTSIKDEMLYCDSHIQVHLLLHIFFSLFFIHLHTHSIDSLKVRVLVTL